MILVKNIKLFVDVTNIMVDHIMNNKICCFNKFVKSSGEQVNEKMLTSLIHSPLMNLLTSLKVNSLTFLSNTEVKFEMLIL